MSVAVTVTKVICGAFASTLGWVSSIICLAPWSLQHLSWSGGCLITSRSSSAHWLLLPQTSEGSQSHALLGCLGTSLLDVRMCPCLALLDAVDLSSLDSGRDINRKFSVLTWGLPLRHLGAASL